jgi:hypothetical protein
MKKLWLLWLRFRHRGFIADAKRRGAEHAREMGWD